MANPLANMMGKINPSQMVNTLMNSNPQQLLLNMLQNQNPEGYKQVQQLMASGQDPQQLLNQMLSNLNPQQIQQMKDLANKFGIRL